MLKHRFFAPSNYYNRYLVGIALLIIGLPFSKFLMSTAQFFLLGNWLLFYRNPIDSFKSFFNNRVALILSGIYLLHVVGMLYSSDLKYGLDELRKKLPLLFLPVIIASSPIIHKEHIKLLLKIFVVSVLASSLVSFAIYSGITGKEIIDIRTITIFVSHIRFSLMVCFSIIISAYLFLNETNNYRYIFLILIGWFIYMLFILESITGLSLLALTIFLLLTFYIFKNSSKKIQYIYFFSVLTIIMVAIGYVITIYQKVSNVTPIDFSSLDKQSANGELYYHNTESKEHENGNYIWIYIANNELKNTWNELSHIPFDSLDLKGNPIQYTLVRFLASKGLRKDRDGLLKLTKQEITAIEKGIANVEYLQNSSIHKRLHQIIWEIYNYKNGYNPNGHSLTMRLEFWKAAWGIIKENPLLGVGTGDVNNAFLEQYNKIKSPLDSHNRLRAHNQYLEIAVALGIIGLFIFLFCIAYPIWLNKNELNFIYASFIIIALGSMITEDTLETQAGVTFFALFNSLLLIKGENTSK
ncbi:MAG: O-antigen ligase family protein [Bacteroidia bacterium]